MVTAMRHAIFDLSGKFLREEVGIYLREQRRLVPVGPLEARHRTTTSLTTMDRTSQAKCSGRPGRTFTGRDACHKPYCPRHDAEAYADHQARHATDTIPPC